MKELDRPLRCFRVFRGAPLAGAFGVPAVVLFGASNPVTWAPRRIEASGIGVIETVEVIAAVEELKVRA